MTPHLRPGEWASRRSPAPDHVAAWSPSLVGQLVHRAVQHTAERDLAIDSPRVARAIAAAVTPALPAQTHRLMLLQRVAEAVWIWGTHFDPRPRWTFLGAELHVGSEPLDLLWIREGQIRGDELKLGPLGRAARIQAERLVAAGCAAMGAAFVGVRLLSVRSDGPRRIDVGAREAQT